MLKKDRINLEGKFMRKACMKGQGGAENRHCSFRGVKQRRVWW